MGKQHRQSLYHAKSFNQMFFVLHFLSSNSWFYFQIPQFILDDMIESGLGGCCNIICTQPRRIAVCYVGCIDLYCS